MREFNIEFSVSLSEEDRKAGNSRTVKTTVLLNDTELDACIERGIKNRVIAWQSNIKANWEKFIGEGFPEELNFSDVPFASTKSRVVTRPPTDEEVENFMAKRIAALSPDELQEFIKTGKLPQK